ncbi:MAG: hypothetical protein JW808_00395, partial [Victivallales bacterium]|nr:hypothetical protein [Victivallales bacterium]
MNPHREECMGARRVGVSGIGMISAAGNDVDASLASMLEGKRSCLPTPSLFNTEIGKPVFECPSDALDKSLLPHMRTFALCLKALEEALADAGICLGDLRTMNAGVSIGTTVSCNLNDLEFYSVLRRGDCPGILPLKRYLFGDISLCLAEMAGLCMPVLSVANACSSGANAIAVGASWIRSGACDIVVVGGADELNRIPYCGFNSLQVMSDEPCLPFDDRRKGLSLGEGAGIIILESLGHALSRGHRPAVELVSWGEGSDAFHI